MTTPNLGRLERVPLRQAWPHEAHSFTPWLAQDDNLQLLAQSIGLPELELTATEHPVGDFRIDILCKDPDDGQVIIENQLERTNHSHLGQILTYAAGAEARKVIWVAESFRPEHVAALQFLNQHTTGDLNFFAVEVEVWRIGASPLAPRFNVVVQPNNWSKASLESVRAASTATPLRQQQLAFWTAFVQHIEANRLPIRHQAIGARQWLNLQSLGRSGFHITATMNVREQRLSVQVRIHHEDAKAMFAGLLAQREAIEAATGFALEWLEQPEDHVSRIMVTRPGTDLANEAAWPEYCDWLARNTIKLHDVFKPRVRAL